MNDQNLVYFLQQGVSARLDAAHTAKLLGFAPHDVPVLVGARLLKPLGNPTPNAPKYFALVDILEHASDREWLNQATKALAKHWQHKNDAQHAKKTKEPLSAEVSASGTPKYADVVAE